MNEHGQQETRIHEDRKPISTPPEEASSLVTRSKGDYALRARLGTGSFGEVYLAEEQQTGRQVALKLLLPNVAHNSEIARRFRSVVERIQALKHPNIITVYGYEIVEGRPTIVMEYVPGKSLRQILRERGTLPVDEVLDIAVQLCDALIYAHDNGFIHRDVKPDNILITPDAVVKLGDFDIAKVTTSSTLTRMGVRLGTPYYMSPEQIRGQTDVDVRSDVFSMGTVLYEMLTGEVPVGHFGHPSELNPDLPRRLDSVILKALARDRNVRYSSMREFRRALLSLESEAILIYRIWEPCPPKRSILRHFRRHIRLKPLSGYRPVCLAADWDDNLYVAYGKEDGQGYVETYQSDGQPVAWEEGQDKWELQGYPKALVVHRGQRREEREVFVLLVACSADEHQYTVCWRDILPSDCSADLAADPVGGTFMSLNNGRPRLLRVDRLGVDNGKSGTINLPQDQGKELAARSLATMSRPQEMTELFALSKKGVHVTELPKGRLDAEWADMLSGQGYHVYATDKPKPCIYVSGRQHVHAFKRSGNQGGWSNRWSLHVGHYETLAIGTHWLYLLRQEQDTHRIDRYWLRGYWRLYILLHDFGVLAAEWQGNT